MKNLNFSVLFFFLFAVNINIAQQEQEKFIFGSAIGYDVGTAILNKYDETGMNSALWRADSISSDFLDSLNVLAYNVQSTDWINHYATGYYSKWEAEENQTTWNIAGVKHKGGTQANWQGISCWSTLGLTGSADSLMYGPHYSQSKRYWRAPWAYNDDVTPKYNARFHMALDFDIWEVDYDDPVCVIKVVYRYAEVDQNNQVEDWHEEVFLEDTLTVFDFPSDGSFDYFYFDDVYQYLPQFGPTLLSKSTTVDKLEEGDPRYVDWFGDSGIQFWVEWLGTPNVGTLYIDHAEVYDNFGWNDYIDPLTHNTVISRITNYVQDYSDWTNIKYWYAHDEPNSMDAFIPIRTVDSLVRDAGGAPLITAFWEVGVVRNNIPIYEKFYEVVQPKKLMFQSHPVWAAYNNIRPEDFELLRYRLQLSHSLQPDFYYMGQAFGIWDDYHQQWYRWRLPEPEEVRAPVMLALAHGTKGLNLYHFNDHSPLLSR